MGRTGPDLHLIKQVYHGARLAVEAPPLLFAGIRSVRIASAVEVLVFPIRQLLYWLLFGCKTAIKPSERGAE
jgi:hypothetical protein